VNVKLDWVGKPSAAFLYDSNRTDKEKGIFKYKVKLHFIKHYFFNFGDQLLEYYLTMLGHEIYKIEQLSIGRHGHIADGNRHITQLFGLSLSFNCVLAHPLEIIMRSIKVLLIVTCCFWIHTVVLAQSPATIIDESALSYYQESYEACRNKFRNLSSEIKQKNSKTQISRLRVPSQIDGDLTIDFCYLPALKKSKLVIISCGVHGVEGFAGSAVQRMFMKEILPKIDLKDTGIFLIHGMNPYGFKYVRRVTENNVDLNRNCDVDRALFSSKNEGYSGLVEFLNPQEEVDIGSMGNRFFFIRAVLKILQESIKSLRQSVLQGQYVFEKGIFFGGKDFEPQVRLIQSKLIETIRNYDAIFGIDLHTGWGARNTLHLFPNPVKNQNVRSAMEMIFDGYHINWGDTEDFYTTTGDFSDFIGKINPGKFYIPMTFEFGTMDSHTTMGSVRSLHNMIIENQGFHYGYKTKNDEIEVKKRIRQMYFPSSKEWRTAVIRQAREIFLPAIKRFQALDIE
jgi:hypothetical protein